MMTTRSLVGIVVLGAGFFYLDQWSKKTVRIRLAGRSVCWRPAALRLRAVSHIEGFYSRTIARVALVVVWCAALASAILLSRFGAWFHNRVAGVGLALALGGAAGNLADILRRRSIVNFVEVGRWPAFNVADVGIIGGLILAFLARE